MRAFPGERFLDQFERLVEVAHPVHDDGKRFSRVCALASERDRCALVIGIGQRADGQVILVEAVLQPTEHGQQADVGGASRLRAGRDSRHLVDLLVEAGRVVHRLRV